MTIYILSTNKAKQKKRKSGGISFSEETVLVKKHTYMELFCWKEADLCIGLGKEKLN